MLFGPGWLRNPGKLATIIAIDLGPKTASGTQSQVSMPNGRTFFKMSCIACDCVREHREGFLYSTGEFELTGKWKDTIDNKIAMGRYHIAEELA